MRLHRGYLLATIVLFFTEVVIAAYVRDTIIRPYGGDFLVVILMYCFVKSFTDIPPVPAAIGVLLFSYLIETLQYFHFINWLGLQNSRAAQLILGVGFAWGDMLAYTLGIALVMIMEQLLGNKGIAAI